MLIDQFILLTIYRNYEVSSFIKHFDKQLNLTVISLT